MISTDAKDLHEKSSPNLTYFEEKKSKLINLYDKLQKVSKKIEGF
jgi:hypothetical protein